MDKETRKKIILAYREKKPEMGVLTITNTQSNTVYVEGSINLPALSNKIRFMLASNQFEVEALQKDWDTLGAAHFEFKNVLTIPFEKEKKLNYPKRVSEATAELKARLQKTMKLY